jgi:hypothetical protein
MKTNIHPSLAFLIGSVLAALLWWMCWPGRNQSNINGSGKEPGLVTELTSERTTTKELVRRIKEASIDDERYKAASRLDRVPATVLQQALEQELLVENNQLTRSSRRFSSSVGRRATD